MCHRAVDARQHFVDGTPTCGNNKVQSYLSESMIPHAPRRTVSRHVGRDLNAGQHPQAQAWRKHDTTRRSIVMIQVKVSCNALRVIACGGKIARQHSHAVKASHENRLKLFAPSPAKHRRTNVSSTSAWAPSPAYRRNVTDRAGSMHIRKPCGDSMAITNASLLFVNTSTISASVRHQPSS